MNPVFSRVEPAPIAHFNESIRKAQSVSSKFFDFSQAVPCLRPPLTLNQYLVERMGDSESHLYSSIEGIREIRANIAQWRFPGANISVESCLITPGANYAMVAALKVACRPGERLLLPEPYYFNHLMAFEMLGLEPVRYPLSKNDGFQLEAQRLMDFAEENKVRGIVLVNPNNPTGAQYSVDALERLSDWAKEKGIYLFIDETYLCFADEGHAVKQPPPENVALIGSFSKSHSLCGYRVGYLFASDRMMESLIKFQDTLVICPPVLGQWAAQWALKSGDSFLKDHVGLVKQLGKQVKMSLEGARNLELYSTGPFFAYVGFPNREKQGEALALSLYEKTGVAALPGVFFGPSQGEFIRVSYANLKAAELEEALERLKSF